MTTVAASAPTTLGLREVAERLGVHYMTAYRYVRTGRLEATKVGGEWQVTAVALDQFLADDQPRARPGAPDRDAARGRLHARLVVGDEAGAWNVLEEALVAGAEPAEIHLELILPTMARIGDLWATGRLSIIEEHLASSTTARLIGRLGPRFPRRGRRRGTAVVGAAPNDRHSLPAAVAADLLRGAGYDVVELGADTPVESFLHAVERTSADCVVVAVTLADNDEAVAATVEAVAATGTRVLLGGGALDVERAARFPRATFVPSLSDLVDALAPTG